MRSDTHCQRGHAYPEKYGLDVNGWRCPTCHDLSLVRNYVKNREKLRVQRLRARQNYKESAINMYSNGDASCKWCGQADMDVLALDHIHGEGNKQRKLL